MDEDRKNCQHVSNHACSFQGEPTIEDCLFCLPTSAASSYRMALMQLGNNAEIPFSEAYAVYSHFDSASQKFKQFHKLMKEHHPETYKRSTPKMVAVVVGPNPILSDNPFVR